MTVPILLAIPDPGGRVTPPGYDGFVFLFVFLGIFFAVLLVLAVVAALRARHDDDSKGD